MAQSTDQRDAYAFGRPEEENGTTYARAASASAPPKRSARRSAEAAEPRRDAAIRRLTPKALAAMEEKLDAADGDSWRAGRSTARVWMGQAGRGGRGSDGYGGREPKPHGTATAQGSAAARVPGACWAHARRVGLHPHPVRATDSRGSSTSFASASAGHGGSSARYGRSAAVAPQAPGRADSPRVRLVRSDHVRLETSQWVRIAPLRVPLTRSGPADRGRDRSSSAKRPAGHGHPVGARPLPVGFDG